MKNDMIKLGIDLGKGKVQQYSAEEANETLRKAFLDLMEISDAGKIDRKTFRRHKVEIFEILEVILEETINEGLQNQFSDFAEIRNLKWGDTNKFLVPDNQLFRVAMISDGNANIRRQRLRDGQEFVVGLDTYAVKIYEEFHRFLAGRINWADMINKVSQSFQLQLQNKIYEAIYNSYGQYSSTYHWSGTLTEDKLVDLAMHVEARTGERAVVYGTKQALRKLAPSSISQNMIDDRNHRGFYGEIAGIELREIKQAHKIGTDEFVIDNNFVLVLPESGDKMVKIVNEGEAIISDTQTHDDQAFDMSMEYFVAQRFGIAVVCSKVFGFVKLA